MATSLIEKQNKVLVIGYRYVGYRYGIDLPDIDNIPNDTTTTTGVVTGDTDVGLDKNTYHILSDTYKEGS